MSNELVHEKVKQALKILREMDIDAWLMFTRETPQTPDPNLELTVGVGVTWASAFILTRTGEKIALVGRYDVDNVQAVGAYDQVLGYDQSLRAPLRETLERLNPRTIAVNYSQSDPSADGLTHGMWLQLQDIFAGSRMAERFVSSESYVAALRGRKTPLEQARIRAAIQATEKMFKQLSATLKPGLSEQHIARWLTAKRLALGAGTAWDAEYCPVVNAGPASAYGHAIPSTLKLKRGQLLHIDFGLKLNGFCSDLQRVWYCLAKGEKRAPDAVRRAWAACWGAVDAAAARLKPGVICWEVDAAAREYLVNAGYPEYQHALGHHIGRIAHDGSTLLGPRWEKYGQSVYGAVEAGNIFTLELGVTVPEHGHIGLEENVLVTPKGLEWLSTPQRRLWLIE